jgi:hypothetical protein
MISKAEYLEIVKMVQDLRPNSLVRPDALQDMGNVFLSNVRYAGAYVVRCAGCLKIVGLGSTIDAGPCAGLTICPYCNVTFVRLVQHEEMEQ